MGCLTRGLTALVLTLLVMGLWMFGSTVAGVVGGLVGGLVGVVGGLAGSLVVLLPVVVGVVGVGAVAWWWWRKRRTGDRGTAPLAAPLTHHATAQALNNVTISVNGGK